MSEVYWGVLVRMSLTHERIRILPRANRAGAFKESNRAAPNELGNRSAGESYCYLSHSRRR